VGPVQADAAAAGASGTARVLMNGDIVAPGAWMPEQVISPPGFWVLTWPSTACLRSSGQEWHQTCQTTRCDSQDLEDVMEKERDVVCGMQVDPAKAAATSVVNGKTYYFCSTGCKAKFDANPSQYLNQ
jgi:YHS domain-containing protein